MNNPITKENIKEVFAAFDLAISKPSQIYFGKPYFRTPEEIKQKHLVDDITQEIKKRWSNFAIIKP